jgi:heat shock protein HslJ
MKTTLLSILVLTLISCDASTKEFIGTSWKVTGIKSNGVTEKATNLVVLTIKSDTEFTLQLDKNNCFGTYAIAGKKQIQMSDLGCTEMCCDSDFSLAVTKALSQVSTIDLAKDKVSLTSDTVEITFKRYKASSKNMKTNEKSQQEFIPKGKIKTGDANSIGKFEKPTTDQTAETPIKKGKAITLYKSPCKGTCEEFYMEFFEDGMVAYTGKFNAQIQGNHFVKLAPSKSTSLFQEFAKSNFMNFEAKYDNPQIMDLQTTHLTYQDKKIEIRYKYNAPKELQALLTEVEAMAKEALEILKKK